MLSICSWTSLCTNQSLEHQHTLRLSCKKRSKIPRAMRSRWHLPMEFPPLCIQEGKRRCSMSCDRSHPHSRRGPLGIFTNSEKQCMHACSDISSGGETFHSCWDQDTSPPPRYPSCLQFALITMTSPSSSRRPDPTLRCKPTGGLVSIVAAQSSAETCNDQAVVLCCGWQSTRRTQRSTVSQK